jgi:hypothetical protein
MRFNSRTSIVAGMSTAALQAALTNAQQAYLDLSGGAKVVTVAYAQGDGSKSVTYTAAQLQNIVALIKELQAQLGIIRHARRPIRFGYR